MGGRGARMKGVESDGRERQSRETKPGRTREGEGGGKRQGDGEKRRWGREKDVRHLKRHWTREAS